jgi:hypothetical protein
MPSCGSDQYELVTRRPFSHAWNPFGLLISPSRSRKERERSLPRAVHLYHFWWPVDQSLWQIRQRPAPMTKPRSFPSRLSPGTWSERRRSRMTRVKTAKVRAAMPHRLLSGVEQEIGSQKLLAELFESQWRGLVKTRNSHGLSSALTRSGHRCHFATLLRPVQFKTARLSNQW